MNKTAPRILKAATRVFGRKGVSGATTREIARAAKVNEVTLFRCFRNKNELLRQVILEKSRRYEDFFAKAPFETPDDLRRTVESFALTYVASLRENEQFVRTFFGEMQRHLKLCRQLFVESTESMRFKLMNYLIAAQKKGLVRADLDVATGTDALTGMLVIGILRRPLTARVYSNERFSKTCVELFLKGIEP
jgi:AcrR family transcriptional regulator